MPAPISLVYDGWDYVLWSLRTHVSAPFSQTQALFRPDADRRLHRHDSVHSLGSLHRRCARGRLQHAGAHLLRLSSLVHRRGCCALHENMAV